MAIFQPIISRHCLSVRCMQFSSLIFTLRTERHFCMLANNSRPLLDFSSTPNYTLITATTVLKDIPVLINKTEDNFIEYEKKLSQTMEYDWENTIEKLEMVTDKLTLAWNAVSHLHSVRNKPDFREAYQKLQPDLVKLVTRMEQSLPVFNAVKQLDEKDQSELVNGQKRIIASAIRSSLLNGVHLQGKQKQEFNDIIEELAELSTQFQNNVLDSTKNYSKVLRNKADLKGLPQSLIRLMAGSEEKKESGPWKLSLDMPCYEPFMKYSEIRSLRQSLYTAYVSRANETNSEIIEKIRELRSRKAKMLGFPNYATLSLEAKMAESPLAVLTLINLLKEEFKPVAESELKSLKVFAIENGFQGDFMNWDTLYWTEKQRESLYNLNEEKLKEFFPLQKVLSGMFDLAQELFNITIQEKEKGSFDTWDAEVRLFQVYNEKGEYIASFYLDAYSRPSEKQGGAWMYSALDRNDRLNRLPIAYLICNQNPAINGQPSLMNFREVRTLFHEFGHGLQHMLTTVPHASAAGLNNIEWDAVEIPSQFMENWPYDWTTLQKISGHYKTGEMIPKSVYMQLLKAKTYLSGMTNLRQLYFSMLDMELHTSKDSWHIVAERISKEFQLLPLIPEDAFLCAFTHIFSGGYAAGYYSYKWSEVLSADVFSSFKEGGLENRTSVALLGKKFRDTFLSLGGSKHPQQVFLEFRGRESSIEPFLRQYGV